MKRQEKERCRLKVGTLMLLPKGALYFGTHKHDSVFKVRYADDTTLTLTCQACILRIWTNREPFDFQHKICKPLPLFVKSMGSPPIVRLYALLCILCGVKLSGRGTLPLQQKRNGPLIPFPIGRTRV